MRRLAPLVLLFAACATLPRSDYVPGGEGLSASARAEYRRAVSLEHEGEREAALDALDELASRYPLRLGIHLRRLRVARELKGPEFAAALYEPPPRGVDPERAGVLAKMARIPAADVAARTAVLESATAREPSNAFWRLAVADVRLTAHDLIVDRAHREHELGRVQASAESFLEADRILEEARQEAETALQLQEGFKEAELLLGYIATRRSDLAPTLEQRDEWRDTAEYHYKRALALDPACLSARLNLAENYLYFDRYSEARKELQVAVRLAPGEPVVWNNLGYAYFLTGRVDPAIDAYRRALELEPHNARVRTALSDGLRRKGDGEGALAELERADTDATGDRELLSEIAFKKAAIYEHDARYREAVEEYQRHIDLGGNDSPKARSRIRHIYETAFEK